MVVLKQSRAERYSIGQLGEQAGVNFETVRYYERIGLMPKPPRTSGGHRVYDRVHLKRLGFIRRSRELGFSLDEIRALLSLVDGGDYTCGEVRDLTLAHLAEVRGKIADLRRLERSLRAMADECTGDQVPECPVIDVLWEGMTRGQARGRTVPAAATE